MSARRWMCFFGLVFVPALHAGCSRARAPEEVIQTVEVEVEGQPAMEYPAATEAPVVEEEAEAVSTMAPYPASGDVAVAYQPDMGVAPAGGSRPNRLIIKDGSIRLLVTDTDVAIDRVTQVVEDVGGYIISSRVWYQEHYGDNFKYATITIGVPVDEFERALRRLRELAIRVLDEAASGQDVTDEYVDLQSRLENLKATRDRIREFLDQAKTVEEALQVNEQLSQVEAEIAQVQGRMNYLFDRAAYSTITINLEPKLPEITPTPTNTPLPTLTPTPWRPGETFANASNTLGVISRALVEAAIWIGVVILPLVGLPVLVVYGVWRLARRKRPLEKGDSNE